MCVIWALEVSSHGLQVVTSRKVVSGTMTLRVLCAQQTTIAPSTTISTHCALLSIRTTTLFPELSVGACCEVVQVHSLSVSGETLVQFLSIVKSVQRFEPIAWLTLFAPRPSGRESGHVHSPFNVGASVSVSSSSVVVSECSVSEVALVVLSGAWSRARIHLFGTLLCRPHLSHSWALVSSCM